MVRLAGSGPLSALAFDTALRRLFAADGTTGALFAIDSLEEGEKNGAEDVAHGMGWPLSVAVDSARGVVYVVDAKNGKVWSTRCGDRSICDPPTTFLESDVLQHPSFVRVAPDGTVWLATGLEDQRVVAVEPSGKVRRIIGR